MNTHELLSQALKAGATDLKRSSGLLDDINVFPVVDGDTGANMNATLRAGLDAMDKGEKLQDALLLGARGNSGVILAQFLVGLWDSLEGIQNPSDEEIAAAFTSARDLAYQAVSEPVEGTMLTVMTALADYLRENPGHGIHAHHMLEASLANTVAATPEHMERLKRAGVVDSGALGFHILACGLTLFAARGSVDEIVDAIQRRSDGISRAPVDHIAKTIDPEFLQKQTTDQSHLRYCMDVVVEATTPPSDYWTGPFEQIGASVDAVTRGNLLKLHVHCDDPDAVLKEAQKLGDVIRCEAEDMSAQLISQSAASTFTDAALKQNTLRVMADSSMSLPEEERQRLGIGRLENYVNVHGRMVRDMDLNRAELFSRMRDGAVYTTAQTSPEEVRRFLDVQLRSPGIVVYLAVGRPYTGTQELVRKVASNHPARDRLVIVDCKAASGQQGLAVLATARKAEKIEDPAGLVEYAREQAHGCKEYLVIDTLKYLSRTGRIGKVKAAFAGALGVRPIVGHSPQGAITYAKVRSHKAALDEISKRVANHPGKGDLLVMVEHTDNRDWAHDVTKHLKEKIGSHLEVILSPLSSTSSVHMGPGTWGVAVTRV